MSRKSIVLLLIAIISVEFFFFMPYESLGVGRIVKSFIIIYLIWALWRKINVKTEFRNFKCEIGLLAVLPLISAFSSYYYRGQPVLIGLMVARDSL